MQSTRPRKQFKPQRATRINPQQLDSLPSTSSQAERRILLPSSSFQRTRPASANKRRKSNKQDKDHLSRIRTIHVSNSTLSLLCDMWILCVQKMFPTIDLPENISAILQYVSSMLYIRRCVEAAVHLKVKYVPGYIPLKDNTKDIFLPRIIAEFLNNIGYIRMPSGVIVTPFSSAYSTWMNTARTGVGYLKPHQILASCSKEPTYHQGWPIEHQWLCEWRIFSRLNVGKLDLVLVSKAPEGSALMLCSYRDEDSATTSIQTYSPVSLTEDKIQLGAAFQYRDAAILTKWPKVEQQITFPFVPGGVIDRAEFLSKMIESSLECYRH